MKLAILAPTCLLEDYASQSDGIHLTLAYMALKDPVYAAWYKKRSEAGDYVILDNNAYETGEPAPIAELVEAAKRVGAHSIVSPDYPGQHWLKTFEAYERFYDELPEPYRILGIPQSRVGDIRGWSNCFESMFDHNRPASDEEERPNRLSHIGMSILACPNAFQIATGTQDIELNRLAATAHARENNVGKDHMKHCDVKIHYFGFGERMDILPCYRGYGDSMDTKGPVKAGLNGLGPVCGSLMRGSKVQLDLQKEYKPTDMQHSLIQHGIDMLKGYMR